MITLPLRHKNDERYHESDDQIQSVSEGGNNIAGTNVEMNTGTNVDRGD